MNSAFITFCSSLLLLGIAFAWAFKPIFVNMVKLAADMVPNYGMAYLKCIVSMIIAAGICFRETWQPVTDVQASHFQTWDWMIYIGAPVLAALITLNAFLDRSLERADAAKVARQSTTSTTTQTISTKDTVPTITPTTTPPIPPAQPPTT